MQDASPETKAQRERYGMMASLTAVLVNIALVAVKGAIGWLSGSIAILGDAVNNLSDAASGVITLLGFHMAARPADAEHPYGHGRMEYLSGLSVAVMVMAIGVNLLITSFQKCLNPELIKMTTTMLVLVGLSILVKGGLFAFYTAVGKRIGSGAMTAAAADSRNDMLTTGGILAAAVIESVFHIPADGVVGLAMSVYILVSGFKLIHEQISPLLGHVPSHEAVEQIRALVLSDVHVLGMHDLMIHDYGPGQEYASAHVEMPADLSALTMHEIVDGIEEKVQSQTGIHMVIHCDPVVTEDERIPRIRAFFEQIADSMGIAFTVHDLRIVPSGIRPRVIFDCVVPYDSAVSMESIRETIETEFTQYFPGYICMPTMEHSYTG
ncbi:MAG: cation transporter [Clostridia bacterium]|nr:cation transporter [Clostridia bacterium]